MNKYICWYAYSGHETEGHLQLEEPWRCTANSKAEALWKWLCYRVMIKRGQITNSNLSEYLKSKYNEGGWGFCVAQLDKDEYVNEDHYFTEFYTKNQFDK